ncbi:ABC-type glycerol-3-phosphate transport system permease component [Sinorhizobium fredii]
MTMSGIAFPSPRRRKRKQSGWRGLLYIAPAMALVTVFFVLPVLFTVWMSLHKWPLLGTPAWIGLDNYVRMVSDARFMTALGFTAHYTVIVTVAIFAVAFPLAIFVEKQRPLVSVYRTIIFLPVVVGLASASLLWVWLANVDSGLFAPLMQRLGLTNGRVNLLATLDAAFLTIIAMVVWKIAGFTMIILVTGLQAIPAELTEAARIDGAGRWQRFRYLTLPLMRRTMALALILSVTGSHPRLRPVLHHDERGPTEPDDLRGLLHLQPVLRVLQSGLWRRPVDRAARDPGGHQRRAALAAQGGRRPPMRSRSEIRARKAMWERLAYHGIGIGTAFFFLAPFAVTFLSSFRPNSESGTPPLPPWPRSGISFDAYRALDGFGSGIWQHMFNSLVVSIGTVLLTVAVSVLAGYGFSRYRFPFKNVLFVLVIATLMIPFQSILTPLFIILARLGLNNSLFGLMLVYVTLQLPFSVFMMRNAFDAVPKEIEEAARIDGARDLRLLVRVLLPLVMPGIATVSIFAFLNAWNEFFAALVLLSSNDNYTLPVLMTAVRAGRLGAINWGAVQAGVAVMVVPCLIVFLLLQRYYMRGLMAGAVK